MLIAPAEKTYPSTVSVDCITLPDPLDDGVDAEVAMVSGE
jgi:hypothetical protein